MTWFIIKNTILDIYVWIRDKIEYIAIGIASVFILIFAFSRRGNVEIIQEANDKKKKEISETLTKLKEKEIEAHEAAIRDFTASVEKEYKMHNKISKQLDKKISEATEENTEKFTENPHKATEKISELTGFKIHKE